MRKVKLYTAMSLDGLIAGPNHELDWLDSALGRRRRFRLSGVLRLDRHDS